MGCLKSQVIIDNPPPLLRRYCTPHQTSHLAASRPLLSFWEHEVQLTLHLFRFATKAVVGRQPSYCQHLCVWQDVSLWLWSVGTKLVKKIYAGH